MKKYKLEKRFIKIAIIANIAVYTILFAINYIVDPYGVFNSKIINGPKVNARHEQVEYLRKHAKEYDSFILGSSRAGIIQTEFIEKYIDNSKFYNFFVSGANQYDNLNNFNFAIKNTNVKNIFILVDVEDILYYKRNENNQATKSHYLVTGENKYKYYFSYLTTVPFELIKNRIKNYKKYSQNNTEVVKETKGAWSAPQEEEKIMKNHEEYIKKEQTLNINKINRYRKNERNLTKNIENLKIIVNECKQRNIKLIVAVNPHNYNMMNKFDLDAYYRYLYEISQIINYWNFSGYNVVTLDNHHYYEESHFRPYIAERMMKKIFTEREEDKEFGQYVTKENINIVLQQIKQEEKDYEKSFYNNK